MLDISFIDIDFTEITLLVYAKIEDFRYRIANNITEINTIITYYVSLDHFT